MAKFGGTICPAMDGFQLKLLLLGFTVYSLNAYLVNNPKEIHFS